MPPTPDIIDNLKYIVEFLSAAIFTAGTSFELFTAALVSRRPVRAFVHTLTALPQTDPSLHAVSPFLGILLHLLAISPSHRIARTLREGLLPVVFACGARHMSTTHDFLIQFFKNILAPATVFHSVLYQLRIALSTLDNSQTAPMLALHEFAMTWDIIGRILSVRLQMIAPIQLCQCLHICFLFLSRGVATLAHHVFQVQPRAGLASPPLCGLFCPVLLLTNLSARVLERRTPSPLQITQFVLSRDRHFLRTLMLHEYKAHQQKITDQYQIVANKQMISNSGVVNAQYRLLVMRFVDGKEDHTLVYSGVECENLFTRVPIGFNSPNKISSAMRYLSVQCGCCASDPKRQDQLNPLRRASEEIGDLDILQQPSGQLRVADQHVGELKDAEAHTCWEEFKRRRGPPPPSITRQPGRHLECATPLTLNNLYLDECRPPSISTPPLIYTCSLCFNLQSHPVSYKCGHAHCYVCIRLSLETTWDCPTCHKPINASPLPEYELEAAINKRFSGWDENKIECRWDGLVFPRANYTGTPRITTCIKCECNAGRGSTKIPRELPDLIVLLVWHHDCVKHGGTTEPEVGVSRTSVRISTMMKHTKLWCSPVWRSA
ncbi:hypothetical protein B0H14DRAFT_2604749 [Mycena olivaceomarginata]|nr:hypothetical protein B0H14DRAFT_2604749 [Mycena olivaceomarginata]